MFEKFTDRGRKVMSLARQEAQRLNSDMIGTEHVLLGLASEEGGVAHKALKVLGIDEAALRKEIERRIKPAAPSGMLGQMPFTPRAKRMIELAGEEASRMKSEWIDTGHLLLGIIREDEGIAGILLKDVGVTIDRARGAVGDVLGQGSSEEAKPKSHGRCILVHLFEKIQSKFHESRVLVVNGETYLYGPSIRIDGVMQDKIEKVAAAIAEQHGCRVFQVDIMPENFGR